MKLFHNLKIISTFGNSKSDFKLNNTLKFHVNSDKEDTGTFYSSVLASCRDYAFTTIQGSSLLLV